MSILGQIQAGFGSGAKFSGSEKDFSMGPVFYFAPTGPG